MRKFFFLFLFGVGLATTFEIFPAQEISSPIAHAQVQQNAKITEVATLGITVGNMNRSVDFYTRVLSFRKISDQIVSGIEHDRIDGLAGVKKRIVGMQLGKETIELTEYLTPKGRPIPSDSRSNDLWFQHIAIVVKDIDRAYAVLRKNKVQQVSPSPQTLPETIPAAAGIKAFYFHDPDGHNLEIIYFPPDKGDPRWQHDTHGLFLGIDHTAIAVKDTDRSLAFYRDILGLKVAGTSENFGTEQERLNSVFGARLVISGLKTDRGVGVEFLQYLAPPGGRPAPKDLRTNDLAHWQITLITNDIQSIAQRLTRAKTTFVSPGIVKMKERSEFSKILLVRDPDGHGLRIVEP